FYPNGKRCLCKNGDPEKHTGKERIQVFLKNSNLNKTSQALRSLIKENEKEINIGFRRSFSWYRIWSTSRNRRRNSIQHRNDGISGTDFRSVLLWADRLHDLSAHRKLRNQPG